MAVKGCWKTYFNVSIVQIVVYDMTLISEIDKGILWWQISYHHDLDWRHSHIYCDFQINHLRPLREAKQGSAAVCVRCSRIVRCQPVNKQQGRLGGRERVQTYTTSPSTSVAYTVRGMPKLSARPKKKEYQLEISTRSWYVAQRLTIDLVGSCSSCSKWNYAATRKISMIWKCIEPWARTANVIGARGYPSMCSGHIDKLVLVEGGERESGRSSLSLIFFLVLGCIPLLKVAVECFGVFEGSSTHRADSHGRTYDRQA